MENKKITDDIYNIDPSLIKFIVEYEERDCLDIDERSHLLIDYGSYHYDFYITKKIVKEIDELLEYLSKKLEANIKRVLPNLPYNNEFQSKILYPKEYISMDYYVNEEKKGLFKLIYKWLNFPLDKIKNPLLENEIENENKTPSIKID